MYIKRPNTIEFNELLVLATEMVLDVSNAQKKQFWIAVNDLQNIIGFVRAFPKQDIIELATLGVVSAYQKKGVATQLIQTLQQHHQELFLVCVIPGFFEAFGFKRVIKIPFAMQSKVDNGLFGMDMASLR